MDNDNDAMYIFVLPDGTYALGDYDRDLVLGKAKERGGPGSKVIDTTTGETIWRYETEGK